MVLTQTLVRNSTHQCGSNMFTVGALPRTLLLTWWPPTLKYAGGEFVRRLVGVLPAGRVKWAYLSPIAKDDIPVSCECRSFVPVDLHWRLRRTKAASAFAMELTAYWTARRIAEWIRPWKPQVLWVLPELAAVGVGTHLRAMLGIPVHLTLHDVFESAGFGELPAWYVPRYVRRAAHLVRKADSFDGISQEIIEHVRVQAFGTGDARTEAHAPSARRTMVFPPSISETAMAPAPPRHDGDGCFRLALCGSMRTGAEQWLRFVKGLTTAFRNVEIVAVGDARRQAELARPCGVRIVHHAYFASEEELVAFLQASRADAGYAGVWDGEDRRLFAATSFSSKITAYAAAGIPTIFDGPGDSAAWKVLRRWNAGLLWRDAGASMGAVVDLKDPVQWQAMADGALLMCRHELCLERNARQFQDVLGAGE